MLLDTDGKVNRNYFVIGLPTTFIIDPCGQVTYRAIDGCERDDPWLVAELRNYGYRDRVSAAALPAGRLAACLFFIHSFTPGWLVLHSPDAYTVSGLGKGLVEAGVNDITGSLNS